MSTRGGTKCEFLFKVAATGCMVLCAHLFGVSTDAASESGGLHGVTRNSQGLPLADAQVLLHSLEASTDRTALSGAEGSFSLANLSTGRYQLTASKEGFTDSQ